MGLKPLSTYNVSPSGVVTDAETGKSPYSGEIDLGVVNPQKDPGMVKDLRAQANANAKDEGKEPPFGKGRR